MAGEGPDYLSYLLRLWRASDEEGAVWRASLERPDMHQRHGFASLEALFTFLRTATAPSSERGGDSNEYGA
jgi:hypothetical protein